MKEINVSKAMSSNWRYLLFIAVTLILFWALYTWRMALLPFMIGLLLAYLLMPIVKWTEALLPIPDKYAGTRRLISALLVIVVFLGAIALVIIFLVTAIVHGSTSLLNNASQIISSFGSKLTQWTHYIREHLPANMQSEMDTFINNIGTGFISSISGFVGSGSTVFTRISGSFGLLLGFASLPLFVFYLLKDSELIQNNIYSALSPAVAGHTRNIVNIVDKVLGRYLRAQVVTGIIVGIVTYFGLSIIRVPYALPLAFFNGLFAVIPSFGPIIAGVIIVIVVLTEATSKTIGVSILLVVVELAKTLFVVPKITADRLHLHASLVVALLVLGAYFWGVWGVILLVPIVATLVEVFNYIRAVTHNKLTGEPLVILKTGGGPEIMRRRGK